MWRVVALIVLLLLVCASVTSFMEQIPEARFEEFSPYDNSTTHPEASCEAVICSAGYECIEAECVYRRDCPMILPESTKPGCEYEMEADERGCLLPILNCICGNHAHISNCNPDETTDRCSVRCFGGCLCDEGYIYLGKGEANGCVPQDLCPFHAAKLSKCPANEEWSDCGECGTTCEGGITRACSGCHGPPACVCADGFKRSETGACVPVSLCTSQCGENELLYECGTACEPSCQDPRPEPCIQQCVVRVCQCREGFVRHRGTGVCLPYHKCRFMAPFEK